MLSPSPSPLLLIGLVVVIVALLIVAGRVWSQWRLRRWCERQGYELVDWRGARFYEGPGKWIRTECHDAYYIEVRDRQGLPRSGYLVFGSFWLPFSRKVRVEWD